MANQPPRLAGRSVPDEGPAADSGPWDQIRRSARLGVLGVYSFVTARAVLSQAADRPVPCTGAMRVVAWRAPADPAARIASRAGPCPGGRQPDSKPSWTPMPVTWDFTGCWYSF